MKKIDRTIQIIFKFPNMEMAEAFSDLATQIAGLTSDNEKCLILIPLSSKDTECLVALAATAVIYGGCLWEAHTHVIKKEVTS